MKLLVRIYHKINFKYHLIISLLFTLCFVVYQTYMNKFGVIDSLYFFAASFLVGLFINILELPKRGKM